MIAVTVSKIEEPQAPVEIKIKTLLSNKGVEEAVRKEFADIPIMIEIARCESQFRQWDVKKQEVLRGEQNSLDRGVTQINEHYHLEESRRLGYDILTLDGNMKYARYLYEHQGTTPWNWSKGCWYK